MFILEGSLLSKEREMVLDSKDMSLKFFSAVDLFCEPEGESVQCRGPSSIAVSSSRQSGLN